MPDRTISLARVARARTRTLVRNIGFDVVRYPRHDLEFRVANLLRRLRTDLVFDVGANTGQYASQLRAHGYEGNIVSFEPLSVAFSSLSEHARIDALWTTVNCALGSEAGTAAINVAGNSESSSILPMLPRHLKAAGSSRRVGVEQVAVETFDSTFDLYAFNSQSCFLKIDTQGFEREVLAGAKKNLANVEGIQIEMSFEPLYEGAALFEELFEQLRDEGFRIIDVGPMFVDRASATLLQADAVFVRRAHA